MRKVFRRGSTARIMVLHVFALLVVIVGSGSLSTALAQGSGDRAIDQAQRAVRQRIIAQEGGSNLTVLFNTDAQVSRLDLNGFSPRPSLSAPSELLLGSGRVG
jgi:hypothetical protein